MRAKKNQKILYVLTRYFYPVVAGMELNILNTYSNLVQRQWKVFIYTTTDTPEKRNVLKRKTIVRKLEVFRNTRLVYPLKLLYVNLYAPGNIIVLHDFDIKGHTLLLFKVFIDKVLGKKEYTLIFSSHGLFNYGSNVYPGLKSRIRTLIQNNLGVALINLCADGVRAVSKSEKDGLIGAGIKSELIEVIGNGLEPEAFIDLEAKVSKKTKLKVQSLGKYIIQVGRIDRIKNFETVIQALVYIPENVKYLIVGSDSDANYRSSLNAIIRENKLQNRIVFEGVVGGADKYYLMKHALAMVHLTKAEGFGNVVHEALSQGTICIVSKNTALAELVKERVNGFLVNYNDVNGLVKRVRFILDKKNSASVRVMKSNNYSQFNGKSWGDIASLLEKYYIQVENKRLKKEKHEGIYMGRIKVGKQKYV